MQKINLVVADNDLKYLDLLINYIRNSDYAGKFFIKSFSHKDKLQEFLKTNEVYDILLTTPGFIHDTYDIEHSYIVLLQEEPPSSLYNSNDIHKYQPLNQLLSQVVSIYLEKEDKAYRNLCGNRKTRTVSVYSAQGGTGKSTFSINLAAQLASQSQKVFYLNLEHLSYTPFPIVNSNDFSKVLYYLKANPQQIKTQFESFKKHDAHSRVDYFEPLLVAREMLDMTGEEISLLVDIIVERAFYDVLIIDLDSTTHERITAALHKSDVICWLVTDDVQCLNKTRILLNELRESFNDSFGNISSRIRFIQNKRLNQSSNSFEEYGIRLDGYMPYVPEWKAVNHINQLYESLFFKQEAGKIYSRL